MKQIQIDAALFYHKTKKMAEQNLHLKENEYGTNMSLAGGFMWYG